MSGDEVVRVLDQIAQAGVQVWVDGGWGVEALLGEEFRTHSDLDLIVDCNDLERLIAALATLDYAVQLDGEATNPVLVNRSGRKVDVHAIEFDVRGYGVFKLPDGRCWSLPPSAFRGQGSIRGRRVCCWSAEAQVQCHGQGYLPTEKDLSDMERLQRRFEVVLPLQLCRQP